MKNYVAMGVYLAYRADKSNSTEDLMDMEDLMKPLLRNPEGKLDLSMAKNLERVVAYCQVTKTPKKSFLNLCGRDTPEGQRFMRLIHKPMERHATRQWDPAPPKPVHRDLRGALDEAKRRK